MNPFGEGYKKSPRPVTNSRLTYYKNIKHLLSADRGRIPSLALSRLFYARYFAPIVSETMQKYKKFLKMKLIEILNLNRELLIYFQKAGIRLDDVQYIDLFNEYRTLSAQGEKVSYIVARLATEYAVSERKVYNLIRRFKTDCNLLAV